MVWGLGLRVYMFFFLWDVRVKGVELMLGVDRVKDLKGLRFIECIGFIVFKVRG